MLDTKFVTNIVLVQAPVVVLLGVIGCQKLGGILMSTATPMNTVQEVLVLLTHVQATLILIQTVGM